MRRIRYSGRTIEDLVYTVNGAKVFSELDTTKAFHQLPIHEDSWVYTTITTHIGLFQYLRLHMGISSAQAVFTEAIRTLLADLPAQVNMKDDILVFGEKSQAHQKNLLAVLTRLEEADITLKLGKCQLYKNELTFFGLRFTPGGFSTTDDRCAALRNMSRPENTKGLHSFLFNLLYSARFIKDVCTLTEPPWRLTRERCPWM
jgi:hypothetical protein